MNTTELIVRKLLTLLGMTFIFGIGFLFAFKLDDNGLNNIGFWQAQLIAFLILSFNAIIEKLLNKLCNTIKLKNDSK